MEKTPMYAVLTPPHEGKRPWVAWAAALVSLIALVVSVVTACVVVQQIDRVSQVEEKMLEMRLHFEQILKEFDYENYDYLDPKGLNFEELTLQSVVRKKREAEADSDGGQAVPIYEQAYGVSLGPGSGLRLYQSLQSNASDGNDGPTDSPIKPYHRMSSLWVPKKRAQDTTLSSRNQRLRNELDGARDDTAKEADAEVLVGARRRTQVLQRSSRVKSLHSPGTGVRRSKKQRAPSNTNPVLFRESLVKATERADSRVKVPQPQPVPQFQPQPVPQPVFQPPQRPEELNSRPQSTLRRQVGGRKKRPRKKSPRRRRAVPAVTVAHFVATPANRTSHHHALSNEVHEEWVPAAWMDKLGLNRKYALRRGTVTVKEAGLYYVYAQVLYQPGRFGSGFQIVVDGIPIMECSLAPAQPSHSCHTGGATYLPRNADVYIRDLEHHMTPVRSEENSFFGLVKLMDAPETAEQLILG